MKVQKEINGEMAQPGWVYGVDQPTGEAWIAAGDAEQVVDEARTLKYSPTAPVMTVCVEPADDISKGQARNVPSHEKK